MIESCAFGQTFSWMIYRPVTSLSFLASAGITDNFYQRLQSVQNAAARRSHAQFSVNTLH